MGKFLKYTGITIGAASAVLIAVLMLNILGVINIIDSDGYDVESRSEDGVITCYVDEEGLLSVNITDPGECEWSYEPERSTEELVENTADFDGYHFLIRPSGDSGTGYAVVEEYEDKESGKERSSGVVRFRKESGKVTEILETCHLKEIEDYSFGEKE